MQLENYNAELRLQSAALIDLALALESPTILATPTLQERYRYAALDEIKSVIAARDRAISNYEKEVRAHEAADVANETTRIELRQIIAQLPAEFEAKISDDKYNGPFIAGTNCSFTIRDVYSNSWRSHAIGKKLVVYAYHETKNLPRKKGRHLFARQGHRVRARAVADSRHKGSQADERCTEARAVQESDRAILHVGEQLGDRERVHGVRRLQAQGQAPLWR